MMIPGLILAAMYITYVLIRSYLQPSLGPAVRQQDRVSWKTKIGYLRSLIMPIILIILVLGTIYSGACTPSEAAGIGAVGSFACAIINRTLTWKNFKDAVLDTFKLTGMCFWLIIGAVYFSQLYTFLGARDLVTSVVVGMGGSRWLTMILMQCSLLILGMFMDDWCMILLCTPIFIPIVTALNFDLLWFGTIFMININIAWLTPPYGFNLFYMRSIAPTGVTMRDIIRSVLPFIGCQLLCLIVTMVFSPLATWLPSVIIR